MNKEYYKEVKKDNKGKKYIRIYENAEGYLKLIFTCPLRLYKNEYGKI